MKVYYENERLVVDDEAGKIKKSNPTRGLLVVDQNGGTYITLKSDIGQLFDGVELSALKDKAGDPYASVEDLEEVIDEFLVNSLYDGVHGSQVVIEEDSHSIHVGNAYYASVGFSLAANDTVNFLAVVPAGGAVHMRTRSIEGIGVAKEVNITAELFEDSDYAGGSSVDTFNSNRNSSNASAFAIFSGTTGATKGLDVGRPTRVVSDKKESSLSGSGGEYVMKAGSKYLLELTNNRNDITEVIIRWSWFEV